MNPAACWLGPIFRNQGKSAFDLTDAGLRSILSDAKRLSLPNRRASEWYERTDFVQRRSSCGNTTFLTRLGGRRREPDAAQRAMRLMVVGLLVLPQSVAPAVITVTGTDSSVVSGDGVCSLREAINNANSNGGDSSGGDCVAGDDATAGGGHHHPRRQRHPDVGGQHH